MQKRYCRCGREIQVMYGEVDGKLKSLRFFWAAGRAMGPILSCPKCSKKLSINALL